MIYRGQAKTIPFAASAAGLTFTGKVSKDGAAAGDITGTISELSDGLYKLTAAASDLDADIAAFRLTSGGGTPDVIEIVVTTDPLDASSTLGELMSAVSSIKGQTDKFSFTGAGPYYVNSQTKGLDTDVITAASIHSGAVTKLQTNLATSASITALDGKVQAIKDVTDLLNFSGDNVLAQMAVVSVGAVTDIQAGLALEATSQSIWNKISPLVINGDGSVNAIAVVDEEALAAVIWGYEERTLTEDELNQFPPEGSPAYATAAQAANIIRLVGQILKRVPY